MVQVGQVLRRAFDVMSQSLQILSEAYSAAGTSNFFGPPYEYSKARKSIERFIKQATYNFTEGENDLSPYFTSRFYLKYLARQFENLLDEDRLIDGDPSSNRERMQIIIDGLQEIQNRSVELLKLAREIKPEDPIAVAWMDYVDLFILMSKLSNNIQNLQQSIEEVRALKKVL